jgi:magnesium transporter
MRRILHQCEKFRWIDLSHPSREELSEIQKEFQLHPAFVQDCVDPIHLPKFERLGSTVFMIIRLADAEAGQDADTIQGLTRKVAIFVGPDFIVTVHRVDPDQFQVLTEKCFLDAADRRSGTGPANENKLPLVLVNFLNRALRSYNTPLEKAEDELDSFESALFGREADNKMLRGIHIVRRRLSLTKRILIHTQDVIQRLSPPGETLSPLFQDLRENLNTLVFLTDELLEDATSLLNIQITLNSQKTNDVMRVLTVFSVFFMPLNFLAGIYGMNFENMPELKTENGYYFVLLSMAMMTSAIGVWFHRKGWLPGSAKEAD